MKVDSLFYLVFSLLGLLGCNPERVQYTDALKQEMANKKIKRISDGQVVETVDVWGRQIADIAQQELTAGLAKGGNTAALCRLENLPKTAALAQRYGIQISLLGAADVKNPQLAQKEREVLDAYLYNAEKNLPQSENVQKVADTLFVYNTAVPTDNPICRACFGSQPQPLAIWRLAFPKREVVRRMQVKKK